MVGIFRLLFLYTLHKVSCIHKMTTLIIFLFIHYLHNQLQLTKRR